VIIEIFVLSLAFIRENNVHIIGSDCAHFLSRAECVGRRR
jgi:hypothetical protein